MLGDIWFVRLQHRWHSRSSRMHHPLFCAPVEYCEALHRDISHLLGGHHINMNIHIDDFSRESWGFIVINRFVPTSTRSTATIDLIMAPALLATDSFSVLPSVGSDHYPVLWKSTLRIPSTHSRLPIKRTRWTLLEIFLSYTAAYWLNLASMMQDKTAFFTIYERFLALCVARLTFVSFRHSYKPSLPPHLINLVHLKRQWLNLFRKTRHPFHALMLKEVNKISRQLLFTFKRQSWQKYCQSFNEGDAKSFWKKAKRHFGSAAPPLDGLIFNKEPVFCPEEMCRLAMDHYQLQFAQHANTNSDIELEADQIDKELTNRLANSNPSPIGITYGHLLKAIASLKNKNSSGVDGISNRILKTLPRNHLPIIFSCFNIFAASLKTPSHWHTARIILLSKKRSKVTPIEDTRPISLLPCFSKIYEKCFLFHLRKWIDINGILPEEQSGFRPGHNMNVRIVAMIDQIEQSLSKNTGAAALFVDFKAAFNQLWYEGLWLKLNRLECPIYYIAWLRRYLHGREAYIELKNRCSNKFALYKGVPQGSCIGPVLFILYHHDLISALETIHWNHIFADDLAVVFSSSMWLSSSNMMLSLKDQIEHVLLNLTKYAATWKQEINFDKTCWTLFHRQVAPRLPEIIHNEHPIEHVKQFKYLETIIDAKLSFSRHMKYTVAKIRGNLKIIKRLLAGRMLTRTSAQKLFSAHVRSHYQSMLNVFPALSQSNQQQLESRNRQVFRYMHYWPDATNLEIESLPDFSSFRDLCNKHWVNLINTIRRTSPSVLEDLIQHKLSALYMNEYLTNRTLTKERKEIFGKGRIRRNVKEVLTNNRSSLLERITGFGPSSLFFLQT